MTDIVRAVTGWDTSLVELMRMGKRALTMARVYNIKEGFTAEDDWLPPRFFNPTTSGPLSKIPVIPKKLRNAIQIYYEMMNWNRETGVPTETTLKQLDLSWAIDHLPEPLK